MPARLEGMPLPAGGLEIPLLTKTEAAHAGVIEAALSVQRGGAADVDPIAAEALARLVVGPLGRPSSR